MDRDNYVTTEAETEVKQHTPRDTKDCWQQTPKRRNFGGKMSLIQVGVRYWGLLGRGECGGWLGSLSGPCASFPPTLPCSQVPLTWNALLAQVPQLHCNLLQEALQEASLMPQDQPMSLLCLLSL